LLANEQIKNQRCGDGVTRGFIATAQLLLRVELTMTTRTKSDYGINQVLPGFSRWQELAADNALPDVLAAATSCSADRPITNLSRPRRPAGDRPATGAVSKSKQIDHYK